MQQTNANDLRLKRVERSLLSILSLIVLWTFQPVAITGEESTNETLSNKTVKKGELSLIEQLRERVNAVYYDLRGGTLPPSDSADSDIAPPVIYGDDNRIEYFQVTNPGLQKVAEATCVVVSVSEISDNGDGTYTLSTSPWTSQSGAPLCAGEPFAGQQQLGFCSGFLVGDDIVVTAGHCVSSGGCSSVAYVFGFWKTDAPTPAATIVSADNVYFCSGIIDHELGGDLDHSVTQLDRPVVGRSPIRIRRSGVVSDGDSLTVVGHPVVLPMKIAGGAIVQNANGATPWFQANLDTYGGNSGSPVVNLTDFTVEGILVRGAPDFVTSGGCTSSNQVPNSGNIGGGLPFEEASKTISFASFVPDLVVSAGAVAFDRTAYSCSSAIDLKLEDIDLAGLGSHLVLVTSSAGDMESVTLTETVSGSGVFTAILLTSTGALVTEDGTLQVSDGDTLVVQYNDADDGTGSSAVALDSADTDCNSPIISGVTIVNIGGGSADVQFTTNENASGRILFGTSCGALTQASAGPGAVNHQITLTGLSGETNYFVTAEATDPAGNVTSDDNGGACFTFTTLPRTEYFTENFPFLDNDVAGNTFTFTPDSSVSFYNACRTTAAAFPTDPTGGTVIALGDDGFAQIIFAEGQQVLLYGVSYSSMFVGSNGYLTFGAGDSDFDESLGDHFGPEPRISALFDDLNPSAGGTISSKQLSDRMVVTYENVPEFGTFNSNNFQIELLFDGRITITLLGIDAIDGLIGLSAGSGIPQDFVESNFSAFDMCCPDNDNDGLCEADDNCPNESNPGQTDTDSDTVGDLCDNCPDDPNTDQTDADADGIGAACDRCDTNPISCCCLAGDANNSGGVNISDVTFLIARIFAGGEAPSCSDEADADGNGGVNVADVTYLIARIFAGGPAPVCGETGL